MEILLGKSRKRFARQKSRRHFALAKIKKFLFPQDDYSSAQTIPQKLAKVGNQDSGDKQIQIELKVRKTVRIQQILSIGAINS